MKHYFYAFAMCQSMFCALPFPWNIWDEDARDKMLLFLPIVGLEIGFIWFFAAWISAFLGLSQWIAAVILTVLPFVLTGYIHLDGFMDVTDAVKSCRDLEKRRQILKDPHVGSFAVIGCCVLFLCQFACFASTQRNYGILIFLPAVSRCCSVLAITLLKPMSTSQYALQGRHISRAFVFCGMLVLFFGAGFAFFSLSGVALLGCMLGSAFSIYSGYRNLGGMNGDISGYAITVGELCGVAVLSLMGGVL